jgi:hypothetical protein
MVITDGDDPIVQVSVMRRWIILATVVLGSTVYNATILIASGLQPRSPGQSPSIFSPPPS